MNRRHLIQTDDSIDDAARMDEALAVAAARRYRSDYPGHDDGVVLVWQGEAYGWKNELRDPQHERPGVYAVDADGRAYLAMGGNDYDGAERWEATT